MALYYTNSHDMIYYKLDYRNLWCVVGCLTRTNNTYIYNNLTDNDKNNLKVIFDTINEELEINRIDEINSESRVLKIQTDDKLYKFEWNYEQIHYIKYYNDI